MQNKTTILQLRDYLIATVQTILADDDLVALRDSLVKQIGHHRSQGVILDVSELDVMDSFCVRMLSDMARMIRLRGADMIIVGIQPSVAFSMVQLGFKLKGIPTALDLEEGLAYFDNKTQRASPGSSHGIENSTRPSELPGGEPFNAWKARKAQRIRIAAMADIVTARRQGRELADRCGSSRTQATLIATVISELSRNMILYAQGGTISLSTVAGSEGTGIVIGAEDKGPGIPNVERVMMGGYSTSGGLGLGLSGTRRIADEFRIDTQEGKGTKITVTKWLV